MAICRHVSELDAYVPGEQPQNPGIIKLNTNENPYPPSPKVDAAVKKFDCAALRLYSDPVFMDCRRRIAEMWNCKVEQIFVGNGSDEILALFTRAFIESPDGSLGYFDPSYSLYGVLADIRNCKRAPVALDANFKWSMPDGYRASAFIITNPNAPTSLAFDKADIAAFASSFDGAVLIDEAYADFAEYNCMDLAAAPSNTNTIVMRTLSKSYSLAGLRFGYCVGPEPMIEALYKIKDSYNMDRLAQLLGLAALEDTEHMMNNVRKIRATRAATAAALKERSWQILESSTNFLFAKPPRDAAKLFEDLRKAGIFVRYFPTPRTKEYLRITIGTDEEMTKFIETLDAISNDGACK